MQTLSRYAIQSLIVASIVLALKMFAWSITGSVALLSDALESIINVAVAGALWVALNVSAIPPDANHPFGHHKAEYFSAGLEGALIIVAAVAIFYKAVTHFIEPAAIDAPVVGIVVNIIASVMNAVWGIYLIRVGKRERSPALEADGRHVLSDVWSSIGVVVGVAAAVYTGYARLDALVAACVGCYILFSGWDLLKSSVGGLMDEAVAPETLSLIQSTIEKTADGAIEAHDLQTRPSGPVTFIQFHLIVPAEMSVARAHDICDRIEHALWEAVPGSRVSIHVEPEHKAKHAGIIMRAA